LASLFVGHAAQQSKLHNLQYDEGGNHMAETERETVQENSIYRLMIFQSGIFLQNFVSVTTVLK
jgi:hypothetical protein